MESSSKVYVSGALTSVEDVDAIKRFYEGIGEICVELGLRPYIPHLHTDPERHADVHPEEVWRIDKEQVLSSSLLVAYVGIPSLGVGMEVAYAEDHDIPIVLMYESNERVSRMARGLPSRVKVAEVVFENYQNGLSELRRILVNWRKDLKQDSPITREGALHVKEKLGSNGSVSEFTIIDNRDAVLLNLAAPSSEDQIRVGTLSLRQKGLMPLTIYVPTWSKSSAILTEVWPNAKLLQDYQEW